MIHLKLSRWKSGNLFKIILNIKYHLWVVLNQYDAKLKKSFLVALTAKDIGTVIYITAPRELIEKL
jgi:hypothetical protein